MIIAFGHRRWFAPLRALSIIACLAMISVFAGPATAHKDHRAKQEAAQVEAPRTGAHGSPATGLPSGHAAMAADPNSMAGTREANEQQTFAARLLDWLGRFHPMLVHFPIAFIPAALFTAIVGRRRPGFAQPVRFLVVTAGITAPFAMLSGWLGGGFDTSLDDWVMLSHRWLGTGIGIGAFATGLLALTRPERIRGSGMIVALSILTAAILVQGWFGGALVHGVDHLNW